MQRKTFLDLLDLVAAMIVFVALNGVLFPGSDDIANIPRIYQLQNPELYRNDFVLREMPVYYAVHYEIIKFFSGMASIKWTFISLIIGSHACLLIAMRRLSKQISGFAVPAIGFELLMLGYRNTFLMADYCITSSVYSNHYPSIALAMLGFTLIIGNRLWLAVLAFIISMSFHIQVGGYGVLMALCIWLWRAQKNKRLVVGGILAILSSLVVIIAVWRLSQSNISAVMSEAVRIIAFVRSPHHAYPFSWDRHELINFMLVIICLLVILRKRTDMVSRSLGFAGVLGSTAILVYLINNIFMLNPYIFFANAIESAPYMLILFYVFASVTIIEKAGKGLYVTALLFFMIPNLQFRILLFLTVIVVDALVPKLQQWRLLVADIATGFSALLAMVILAKAGSFGVIQKDFFVLGQQLSVISLFIISIAVFIYLSRLKMSPSFLIIIVSLVFLGYGYATDTFVGIKNIQDFGDSQGVANFARLKTRVDACFIIPPDMYNFQYLSLRSAFVTFKRIPSVVGDFPEWFRRMQLLRTVDPQLRPADLIAPVQVNFNGYNSLRTEDFTELKKRYEYISHCVVSRGVDLSFPLQYENSTYRIYALR